MRPLSEINFGIEFHRQKIKDLTEEVLGFRGKCPHPVDFITRDLKEYTDGGMGVELYDSTIVSCTCNLCGEKRYKEFDKTRDKTPTNREVMLHE